MKKVYFFVLMALFSATSLWATMPDGRRTDQIDNTRLLPNRQQTAATSVAALSAKRNDGAPRSTMTMMRTAAAANAVGEYTVSSLPYNAAFPITEWTTEDIWGGNECIKFNLDTNTIKQYAIDYTYNGWSVSSFGFDCMPDTAYMFCFPSVNEGYISAYHLLVCNPQLEPRKWGSQLMMLNNPEFDYSDFSISLTTPQTPRRMTMQDYLDEVRTGDETLYTMPATDSIHVKWSVTPAQPLITDVDSLPFSATYRDVAVSAQAYRVSIPQAPAGKAYTVKGWINNRTAYNGLDFQNGDIIKFAVMKYQDGKYIFGNNTITEGGEYILLIASTVSHSTVGEYDMQFWLYERDYVSIYDTFDTLAVTTDTTMTLDADKQYAAIAEFANNSMYYKVARFDLTKYDSDAMLVINQKGGTAEESGIVIIKKSDDTELRYETLYDGPLTSDPIQLEADDIYVVLYSWVETDDIQIGLKYYDIIIPTADKAVELDTVYDKAPVVTLPHSGTYTINAAVMIDDYNYILRNVHALRFVASANGMVDISMTNNGSPLNTNAEQKVEIWEWRNDEGRQGNWVYGNSDYGQHDEGSFSVRAGQAYYIMVYDLEDNGLSSYTINLSAVKEAETVSLFDIFDTLQTTTNHNLSLNQDKQFHYLEEMRSSYYYNAYRLDLSSFNADSLLCYFHKISGQYELAYYFEKTTDEDRYSWIMGSYGIVNFITKSNEIYLAIVSTNENDTATLRFTGTDQFSLPDPGKAVDLATVCADATTITLPHNGQYDINAAVMKDEYGEVYHVHALRFDIDTEGEVLLNMVARKDAIGNTASQRYYVYRLTDGTYEQVASDGTEYYSEKSFAVTPGTYYMVVYDQEGYGRNSYNISIFPKTQTTIADIFDSLSPTTVNDTNSIAMNMANRQHAYIEELGSEYYYAAYKFNLSDYDGDALFNVLEHHNSSGRIYLATKTADGTGYQELRNTYPHYIDQEVILSDELYIILYISYIHDYSIDFNFIDITTPKPEQAVDLATVCAGATTITLPHTNTYNLNATVMNYGETPVFVHALRFDATERGKAMLHMEASCDMNDSPQQRYEVYRLENDTYTLVASDVTPYYENSFYFDPGTYFIVVYDTEGGYGLSKYSIDIKATTAPPADNALSWTALVAAAEEIKLPYTSNYRPLGDKVHINDQGQTYYVDAVKFTVAENQQTYINWQSYNSAFMFMMRGTDPNSLESIIGNEYKEYGGYIELTAGTYYMFVFDESLEQRNYTRMLELRKIETAEEAWQRLIDAGQYETIPGSWQPADSEMQTLIIDNSVDEVKPLVFNIEKQTTVRIEDLRCALQWYRQETDSSFTKQSYNCEGEFAITPGVYGVLITDNYMGVTIDVVLPEDVQRYVYISNDDNYGTVEVESDKPATNINNNNYNYPDGTTLTMTVNPKAGYEFYAWQDMYDENGTINAQNPRTVTLTADTAFEVTYTKPGYEVVFPDNLFSKAQDITLDYSHTNRLIDQQKMLYYMSPFDMFRFTLTEVTSVAITTKTTENPTGKGNLGMSIHYYKQGNQPDPNTESDDAWEFYFDQTTKMVLQPGTYYVFISGWGNDYDMQACGMSYDLSITTGQFSEVATIEEFIQAAITDRDITITGPLAVTYSHRDYHYVTDETGSLLIFSKGQNLTLNPGDRINGLKGRYALYGQTPEMTNPTITTVTPGEPVAPDEDIYEGVFLNTPSPYYLSRYVILRNRTVRETFTDAADLNMTLVNDYGADAYTVVYDKFGIDRTNLADLAVGDKVDIVGIIAEHQGNGQLYPITITPAPKHTVNVTLGEGGGFGTGISNWTYDPGTYNIGSVQSGSSIWFSVEVYYGGYIIDNITINGENVDEAGYDDGRVRFSQYIEVTEDLNIVITFRNYYNATFSAGTGGTISPAGEQQIPVNEYQDTYVQITADAGYVIDKIFHNDVELMDNGWNGKTAYTYRPVIYDGMTILATFRAESTAADYATVTFTYNGDNGYIQPNEQTVQRKKGEPFDFIVNAYSGYVINSVTIGGVPYADKEYVGQQGYSFTATVEEDCEIKVLFGPAQWTVTLEASEGGTITPAGEVKVNHGEMFAFDITANDGYVIDRIFVNGEYTGSGGSWEGQTSVTGLRFDEVTSDIHVYVVFRNYYNITLSAGSGGSITPSGNVQVSMGDELDFTAIADEGYVINYISGTGVNCHGKTIFSHSITPTADQTIEAHFLAERYVTVNVTADEGGTVSPSGDIEVLADGIKAVTITANTGYVIDAIYYNDLLVEDQGWGGQKVYTINIGGYEGSRYRVTFRPESTAADYAAVTFTAGEGGYISPSGTLQKKKGEEFSFSVQRTNLNFVIESVTICGVPYEPTDYIGSTYYTFTTSVTENCEIKATFRPEKVNFNVTHNAGGTTDKDGLNELDYNSDFTMHITADAGYVIKAIMKNDVDVTTDAQRGKQEADFTLENVTDLLTNIHVLFEPTTPVGVYRLTTEVNDATMGRIDVTGDPVADNGLYPAGASVTLTAVANSNYEFVKWEDGETNDTRTITMNSDVTHKAHFRATGSTATSLVTFAGSNGGFIQYDIYEIRETSGTFTIENNKPFDFWVHSNDNHVIESITIDGNAAPGDYIGKFDFECTNVTVTKDCEISATFRIVNAKVTVSTTTGGTTSASSTNNVPYATDFSMTITANEDYVIDAILVDDVDVTTTEKGQAQATFSLKNVTKDTKIHVVFKQKEVEPEYFTFTATTANATMGVVTIDNPAADNRYLKGTQLTVTATANQGYHFVKWSDDNTSPTRTVTITADLSITAEFEADDPTANYYTLTTIVNDTKMGSVTVTGGEQNGDGKYKEGSIVTLTAVPNSDYEFVQWNDGLTNPVRSITMKKDETLTAIFRQAAAQNVTVTITAGTGGKVTPSGTQQVAEGGSLDILIEADPDWLIEEVTVNGVTQTTGLEGEATGTYTYTNATEGDNIEVSFYEEPGDIYYSVTVRSQNSLRGETTVELISGNEQNGQYLEGSVLKLTATAKEGYRFKKWSDGNTDEVRTVTVSGSAMYIAEFEAIPSFTLSYTANDPTLGTIEVSGDAPLTNGKYYEGSVVTLTAKATANGEFERWEDNSTDAVRTITITKNTYVTAYFKEVVSYTVDVRSDDETMGIVTVTGDEPNDNGKYLAGAQITIIATPLENYRFDKWSTGETAPVLNITVDADIEYIAYFKHDGTDVENVEQTSMTAYTEQNMLYVESEDRTSTLIVTDMTGKLVYEGNARTVRLPQRGVYIIQLGSERLKITTSL